MESRITVVQALDERDFLIRKITGRMQKARFVDLIRPKAAVTWEKRMTREAFETQARGALQQLQALIERYDKLNMAVAVSNASTTISTSAGEMTVACAIALRSRLRGSSPYGELTDFEGKLAGKMEEEYREARERMKRRNEAIRRERAPGTSGSEDLMRVFDPLDVRRRAEKLTEEKERLLLELDAKIKISNAVTYVTVS